MITEYEKQPELDFGETIHHGVIERQRTLVELEEQVASEIYDLVHGEVNTSRAIVECLILDLLRKR